MNKEITASDLNPEQFIDEKVKDIMSAVGDGIAINALSGRVDSSTVTMLGHKALGERLKTVFIDNGLRGITDPEEKREAITQAFYRDVFGRIIKESQAKHLLQGTILTDIDETVAGIKRQHNVFEQLGIDPQEAFGYKIIEPLVQLRKDGVRKVGRALGL